ncbi:MAG: site-specific DNA-methyltransferase [Patescibacteria group bacterium]
MPRKKKMPPTTEAASVTSYKHEEKRKRIPTQEESVMLSARDRRPVKKTYQYDPSLDPQLVWSGKAERGPEFGVSTVPIYVQEKIAPEAIIAKLKDENAGMAQQYSLFGETAGMQYDRIASFYEHEDNWQNRMILGDSLTAMNSLLEKEGMRGRVQCVYIDPPYGIKFGSNWQVSTLKRDVKDNKIDDLVRQPEQVKAFRDTWELGIHSYLTYLRDRLIAARELLTESGSCFVQINDENVHLVRTLMDEVFGSENFIREIIYSTSTGLGANYLKKVNDFVIWYGKDTTRTKYRQLYRERLDLVGYTHVSENGSVRPLTNEEAIRPALLPSNAKVFRTDNLSSSGLTPSCVFDFELNGKTYSPAQSRSWKTNLSGMKRLAEKGRLATFGNTLRYIKFHEDLPVVELDNVWVDAGGEQEKSYVVQTSRKIIQRCLLMSTDPGDLVVDPTCGSGTTAYLAEQWGRRWITVDTSRVALALARMRLMTAKLPHYQLKESGRINGGFDYKTVPHVTLRSLANDEAPESEVLYDQPVENKDTVRVSGPFTVESLSPHRVSDEQEMLSTDNYIGTIVENMRRAGIQTGQKGARVEFVNLDILPGGPELQARGEYLSDDGLKIAAVAIGPEFGSVDDDFIRAAVVKAKQFADLLVIAGTSFDASAFAEPAQVDGLRIMKVKINPDLSMGDLLKKTGTGNLFMAFGEPDIRVTTEKERVTVEIKGVDVYDPVKGEIRASGSGNPEHDIAAWFIDTNYDGRSFFVSHAYFLGAICPFDKLKKALRAEIAEEAWDSLCSAVSRSFPKPTSGKIAVKAINHYGDEVMKVIEI